MVLLDVGRSYMALALRGVREMSVPEQEQASE